MIIKDKSLTLDTVVFTRGTSDISQQYAFWPLTAADFPSAQHGDMTATVENINH